MTGKEEQNLELAAGGGGNAAEVDAAGSVEKGGDADSLARIGCATISCFGRKKPQKAKYAAKLKETAPWGASIRKKRGERERSRAEPFLAKKVGPA